MAVQVLTAVVGALLGIRFVRQASEFVTQISMTDRNYIVPWSPWDYTFLLLPSGRRNGQCQAKYCISCPAKLEICAAKSEEETVRPTKPCPRTFQSLFRRTHSLGSQRRVDSSSAPPASRPYKGLLPRQIPWRTHDPILCCRH